MLCPKNKRLMIEGQDFDPVYTTIEFNIKSCNYTDPEKDCYDRQVVQKMSQDVEFIIPHHIIDLR